MADATPDHEVAIDAVGGLLALVFPGAGHAYQGRLKRGVLIAIGVLGLFFGGMLIGGISVVDRRSPRMETRLSFYGQAFVGPIAFAVDRLHQTRYKIDGRPGPPPDPSIPRARQSGVARYDLSIGKPNEIGVLYALLAGFMNFIAFLDALMPAARGGESRRDDQPRPSALDAVLAKERGP